MNWLFLMLAAFVLTACDYTEVKRETGYKGKARFNPWLAAERFCEQYDEPVRSLPSWTPPEEQDAVWFVPAPVLSNESFTRRMESWVEGGGHLVLLLEHADSETNDWSRSGAEPQSDPALVRLLERAGIALDHPDDSKEKVEASEIRFNGETFRVDAKSRGGVSVAGAEAAKPGVFVSVTHGDGRVTVLTDGRLFRNRWIGDKDHAALLDALIEGTDYDGNIGFMRGSGLSLWNLLGRHLWPVLVGLGVLIVLWLWKSFTRFGPLQPVAGLAASQGYDHHLEALGDFQWRVDRGSALLAPLRARIIERGQHLTAMSGHRDHDFFQFLADRAGLPRERVFRALVETSVPDSSILTRTTADLQLLLKLLH